MNLMPSKNEKRHSTRSIRFPEDQNNKTRFLQNLGLILGIGATIVMAVTMSMPMCLFPMLCGN